MLADVLERFMDSILHCARVLNILLNAVYRSRPSKDGFAHLDTHLWKTPVFLWFCLSFCDLVDVQSVIELFGTGKPCGKPCELHEKMSHRVLSRNDSSSIFSAIVPSLTSIAKKKNCSVWRIRTGGRWLMATFGTPLCSPIKRCSSHDVL